MWNHRLAKLNSLDREKIKILRLNGMTLAAIAKRFSVSTKTIWELLESPKSKPMVSEPATQAPSHAINPQ